MNRKIGSVAKFVADSWDLSLEFGGLFNFSHVALFAVGIYTYGILKKTYGVDPWVAILLVLIMIKQTQYATFVAI